MMDAMVRRRAAALVAAAALCMAADAAAQGRVVRLPERDQPLAGSAQAVFTVGKADGEDWEMFGSISGVAFDAQDNLYVLDRQNARVMVYGPTGRFLRQIGREGAGPGELQVPTSVAVAADGQIVVTDLGRSAFSLFRPDGTFVRNVMFQEYMPGAFFGAPLWHPSGGMVGPMRTLPSREFRPGQRVGRSPNNPVIYMPLDGGAPRQVFNVASQTEVKESGSDQGEGRRQFTVTMRIPAFAPRVNHGVLPGGQVALAFTTGYTVRLVDLGGTTSLYIQRPVRTRLTTQADRDRWIARERERIASGDGGVFIRAGGGGGAAPAGPSQAQIRQMREAQLADTEFADTIPAIQALRATPGGKLWIERTPQVPGDDGPVDVVTAAGQYLGTLTGVSLPDAFSRGGLAAWIDQDEDGVQRVVVRRLPAAWR
ncbi:MAG TPA: 6-bladed beta-propeller [Longimicrobium sp.]|nr:6-bladed beta-propeller [Longimicrobium sp.]